MPFWGQTQVYNQESQGVPGDRASQNPMATFDAGPGGLVAGLGGVIVGNFAWISPPTDPNGTNQIANSTGGGNVAGFVYNDLQALDTVFLSDATLVIPEGLPVALAIQGDFWVTNAGTTEASVGQKAYASYANGAVSFAAPTSPTQLATSTGSTIQAETNGWTGSIAGDVLTVSGGVTGTIYPGTTITGAGVDTGTQVASQLTGTIGGVGTYLLSISQQKNIASESMTGTYGLLTIGTLTSTAQFAVGQVATGTGVVSGTVITALASGSSGGGSGGTLIVSPTQAMSASTVNSNGNVETKWYAASAGGPGQLVKMTSWVGTQG